MKTKITNIATISTWLPEENKLVNYQDVEILVEDTKIVQIAKNVGEAEIAIDADGALINDMINLEYRFPVWKKIGGYIFIDSGRLYNKIQYLSKAKMIWDYGVGIIYNTKLGPIRLDMGFPFGNVSNGQLHASLLYMF